jgi:small conductance mechanosensitive channel
LLANFAAGIFLVILQPFKVGDVVVAGGVTGTVEEVGLFVTSINTLETSATSGLTERSSVTSSRTSRRC